MKLILACSEREPWKMQLNSTRVESIAGLVALFGALSITVGYIFEVGYVSGLDSRLLQFLQISDYLTAATSYIFAVPLAFVLTGSQLLISLAEVPAHSFGPIISLYLSEGEADGELKKRLRRIDFWIVGLAFGMITIALLSRVVDWLWVSGRWDTDETCTALLQYLFLGAVLLPLPYSLRRLHTSRARRNFGVLIVFVAILGSMYLYGAHEGAVAKAKLDNDLVLELTNGRQVNAILLFKFATGVAYKIVGNGAVYFVPDAQIAIIELRGRKN